MAESWKFDFGAGPETEGYVKVADGAAFERGRGYGFYEAGSGAVSFRDRGEPAALSRDFCIPFGAAFAVQVPDGIYTVGALIGDAAFETDTTIKGSAGQLLVHRQRTPAGHFEWIRFSVPVTDGTLRLAFSGLAPRLNALEVAPAQQVCTVYIAGDSTATNQPADGYPYSGWGQMLPHVFKADAAVWNHAASGRSSKSFIAEGRLDAILATIKPYDYLIVQFGHNDQKKDEERRTEPFTAYKDHLRKYIEAAKERKAIPILATSIHRRFFAEDGSLADTHGDYLTAMRELAAEEEVPLLDMAEVSREWFEKLGPEATKSVFMWGAPGEFIRFPNGVEDNTHFQERGAIGLAKLAAEALKKLGIQPLSLYFR
ncbi:rhamnogalacturonan acetylesterase [Cohnella caldifontis]|uniref:rhamnogalacturonan acetylesterase n=1 Tax=Cohnella caldifontis TaxID=3027471 RepID=UPI0023EBBA4B|nr:GDSL-type esterase/lipase family protein [Cohnella sp. YIM B05605]